MLPLWLLPRQAACMHQRMRRGWAAACIKLSWRRCARWPLTPRPRQAPAAGWLDGWKSCPAAAAVVSTCPRALWRLPRQPPVDLLFPLLSLTPCPSFWSAASAGDGGRPGGAAGSKCRARARGGGGGGDGSWVSWGQQGRLAKPKPLRVRRAGCCQQRHACWQLGRWQWHRPSGKLQVRALSVYLTGLRP
jgi:hypothetical protein